MCSLLTSAPTLEEFSLGGPTFRADLLMKKVQWKAILRSSRERVFKTKMFLKVISIDWPDSFNVTFAELVEDIMMNEQATCTQTNFSLICESWSKWSREQTCVEDKVVSVPFCLKSYKGWKMKVERISSKQKDSRSKKPIYLTEVEIHLSRLASAKMTPAFFPPSWKVKERPITNPIQ